MKVPIKCGLIQKLDMVGRRDTSKKVPESAQPIVVAIDTAKTRGEELCPPWEMTAWFSEKYPFGAPKGEMYRDFVINTLKPLIDENFMTKPEKEFTGIGGSSMGGIQSFYMHTSRPDVFGRCCASRWRLGSARWRIGDSGLISTQMAS